MVSKSVFLFFLSRLQFYFFLPLLFVTHLFILSKPSNNIYYTEHYFFITIASILILLYFITRLFGGEHKRWSIGKISIFFFLLFIVIFANLIIKGQSFSLSLFLIFGLLLVVFSDYSINYNNYCIDILLFPFVIVVIFSYIFNSTYFSKVGDLELNSGPNAIFYSSICPFVSSILFNQKYKGTLTKILCLIIMVYCLYIVFVSESRTAWIAISIGMLLVINYNFKLSGYVCQFFNNNFKSAIGLFALLIFIASLLYKIYEYKEYSSLGRILIYKVSFNMFIDKPVFGFGPNGFKANYNDYQSRYFANDKDPSSINGQIAGDVEYAFNEYIQVLIEYGAVAMIICIIIIFLVMIYKPKNNFVHGAKISVISILIACLTSYPLHIISIQINFIFFISILINQENKLSFNLKKFLLTKALFLFLIITVVVVLINNFTYYHAINKWKQGSHLALNGRYTNAFAYYEKAYPILHSNGDFLYNYGAELSVAENYKKSLQILTEAKKYQNHVNLNLYIAQNYKMLNQLNCAKEVLLRACNMVPNRFLPKYLLLRLLDDMGLEEESINVAKIILMQPIKVDSPQVDEIKEYAKNYIINKRKAA